MDWSEVTAITTGLLAVATFAVAFFAWRGIVENKALIEATKREADLLWDSAVPHLLPENVDGVGDPLGRGGQMKISYATGTIPARAVKIWVGSAAGVRYTTNDLLTPEGNRVRVLELAESRAGTEPPKEWDEWLRRMSQGTVSFRVVMQWTGPGDHVTTRAWLLARGIWEEVPESLRG